MKRCERSARCCRVNSPWALWKAPITRELAGSSRKKKTKRKNGSRPSRSLESRGGPGRARCASRSLPLCHGSRSALMAKPFTRSGRRRLPRRLDVDADDRVPLSRDQFPGSRELLDRWEGRLSVELRRRQGGRQVGGDHAAGGQVGVADGG